MADNATTDKASVVSTDDKGQFSVSVPRSSIDRVDVIDIDLVLHTKSGERLILPGAALEAMTAAPPSVHFSDGNASAANLLSSVDRVQTPSTSIPAMTSLTQFDQKRTEGKKNRTADGKSDGDAAQEAQAQQVAPLPTQGDSSIDKLLSKADSLESELRKKAFDPAPPKIHETPSSPSDAPGSQPQTAKIPLYMTLAEGNVVGSHTDTATHKVYGAGGNTDTDLASGILTGDAGQYSTETLTGSASADVFYVNAFYNTSTSWSATGAALLNNAAAYAALDTETGHAPTGTAFYYAKEVALNVAGYIRRLDSVTVSGLPDGVTIQGATALGNGSFSIATTSVIPTAATLDIVYDVTTIRAMFNKDSDGDGVNDYVDVLMTVKVTGVGTADINVTKTFVLRFQDVDSTSDITNNSPVYITGSGWSDVYVMPTAGTPQLIVTDAGSYDTAKTLAQNAALHAATVDGDNTVYGGNSNDTVLAGAGNDTIYAYGGNDAIAAGNGNNLVWAGDGNDTVITGTGDDIVHAGRGNNTVTDGGGDNTVDVILTKTVNGTVVSGNGADVVTITGDGDNTVTVGDETDAYSDGNDTVTTHNGTDVIKVGDGDNIVSTGNGDKSVTAGSGNDTVTTGSGNDIITVGAGNNTVSAGEGDNQVTTGSGNDTITLGTGANTVVDGGGSNTITTAATGGKDTVTVSAGTGTDINSIYVGNEDDTDDDGADTVITSNSVDTIHLGDGNNWVSTGNNKKVIYAGSGDDYITTTGGNGDDTISAGDGANQIWAGSGNNVVTAGSGNDTLTTGSGNDTINLGAGANIVTDGGGSNTISTTANGGKDVVSVTAGTGTDTNTIYVGEEDGTADGDDTVWTSNSVDIIHVGDGNNLVTGGNGNKTVYSGTGNDTITLGGGANRVTDTGGDNTITTGDSGGNDVILINGSGTNIIRTGVVDGIADGNDTVITTSGSDTITVGDGDNVVWAADATATNGSSNLYANTIAAGSGSDVLVGGNGTDDISAGAGNDTLYAGTGTNVIDGGADTDWLSFNGVDNSAGTVTNRTTTLTDWVRYAGTDNTSVSFTADATGSGTATRTISGGGTETDTVSNIENMIGTTGDDTLNFAAYTGTTHTLYGLGGNDTLVGSTGQDTLYGGLGKDRVYGDALTTTGVGDNDVIYLASTDGGATSTVEAAATGDLTVTVNANGVSVTFTDVYNYADGGAGADTIIGGVNNDYFVATSGETVNGSDCDSFSGGGGADTIDFSSFTSALVVDLSAGNASSSGTVYARFDGITRVLTGSGADTITGTTGDDVIYAGNGNNSISSGNGNDTIVTGTGNDTINTGAGTDTVYGGSGNDTIWASSGSDVLYGEAGNDLFIGSGTRTDSVTMVGGSGTNTYYANAGADIIDDTANAGTNFVRYDQYQTVGTVISSANYGVFVNLSTTDYGVASGGALTASATASYWWTGSTWAAMITTSYSAYTWAWNADNDQRGFYGNADGDRFYNVEYIIGSGYNDVLIGSLSANIFYASGGNDAMYGLDGNDTFYMTGGLKYIDGGNDIDTLDFSGITGSTVVTANLATQTATIAGVSGTSTIKNIENLIGGSGDDVLTGDANDNTLNGGLGADTMTGGAGNDTYYVNSTSDVISELSGEGTDTVYTTFNYTLSANLENLVANTTTGLVLTGNSGVNTITGNGGADTIDGGAGADSMAGGAGNDVYYVDNVGDVVSEASNSGTDTVYTSVDYTLTSNIEIMIGTGSTGLTLTGNTSANTITGTSGADIINGGTGADTMTGGSGNDTYYVDNTADVVSETSSGGTDTIYTTVNYTMSSEVEIMIANTTTGLTLTGNTLANTITGNSGADIINGGTGADTMIGGTGNDTYYVDNTSDVVSEASGAGTDTIYTTVNYTASANVENLLANTTSGLALTGNSLTNTITGNSGADTIDGGTGADTMIGGAGNDIYYVDNTGDVVSEASGAGTDTIYTSVNYTLSSNAEILIANSSSGLTLTGNTLACTITGGTGDDTIVTTAAVASSSATAYQFNGGSGNDTLNAANWSLNNLDISKLTSIETLDLRGGSTITTSALTNTAIAGILDNASGSKTLTIYLDSGDTFTTTNASVTTSAVNDGNGHTGTHYTYTGSTTYYVDVYKV